MVTGQLLKALASWSGVKIFTTKRDYPNLMCHYSLSTRRW
ncbi:hypothetical protein COO91_09730 (plasmid) [Nostoc flagelliforme CCNUN1]|uniref:Uncharacterized protein n=1 Tax=Nostoc flagelliforme CCNUN1 TaxID=2038116 RepID=A0A2K8T7C5_9NOSO|nr:hypothetical protein COO91_09730 [Nostoc flagelliforme CCNUN1]